MYSDTRLYHSMRPFTYAALNQIQPNACKPAVLAVLCMAGQRLHDGAPAGGHALWPGPHHHHRRHSSQHHCHGAVVMCPVMYAASLWLVVDTSLCAIIVEVICGFGNVTSFHAVMVCEQPGGGSQLAESFCWAWPCLPTYMVYGEVVAQSTAHILDVVYCSAVRCHLYLVFNADAVWMCGTTCMMPCRGWLVCCWVSACPGAGARACAASWPVWHACARLLQQMVHLEMAKERQQGGLGTRSSDSPAVVYAAKWGARPKTRFAVSAGSACVADINSTTATGPAAAAAVVNVPTNTPGGRPHRALALPALQPPAASAAQMVN